MTPNDQISATTAYLHTPPVTRQDVRNLTDLDLCTWHRWTAMDEVARAAGLQPKTAAEDPKAIAQRCVMEMGQRLMVAGYGSVSGWEQRQIVRAFRDSTRG